MLVRSAKGVALTEIGEALLRRARRLSSEVRRAEEEIAQLRDGAGGLLRVAFSSFAVEQLLPNALLDFRRRWPGVVLELQEFSGIDVKGLWDGRDFDFAILGELDPAVEDGLDRRSCSTSRSAASRGLVGLRLAGRLPHVHVSLLMRDRASLTPAARAFSDALKEVARTMPPDGPYAPDSGTPLVGSRHSQIAAAVQQAAGTQHQARGRWNAATTELTAIITVASCLARSGTAWCSRQSRIHGPKRG